MSQLIRRELQRKCTSHNDRPHAEYQILVAESRPCFLCIKFIIRPVQSRSFAALCFVELLQAS